MRTVGAIVGCFVVLACDDSPPCADGYGALDTACTTSLDCAEAGLAALSCVDGRCRLPCLRDEDCRAPAASDDACVPSADGAAVCEGQVCVPGCPARPCPVGPSRCAGGRCAFAFEGFEAIGAASPTLSGLGWNDLPRALDNPQTFVAFEGNGDCAPGPSCGGVAAEGRRFALLGTQPTPEKGTPRTDSSCRACACCLECRLDPPRQPPSILECPRSLTVPARLRCGPATRCDEAPPPTEVPEVCEALCQACEACPPATSDRTGALLSACEARAADRDCAACVACESSTEACRGCRSSECPEACADRASEACTACEEEAGCPCDDCRDCSACADARSCRDTGGASAWCAALESRCRELEDQGCFPVPVDYPREQLEPGEQALESFAIDLSSASGPVVLEFSYVAFDVGDRYLPGVQGESVCSWETRPQEVLVQLCAGDCLEDSSWVNARFTDGARAAFPPPSQRGNGLPFGSQSPVDWRSGRLVVEIPESLRSDAMRFRFLPRLSENASVGIDDILVRSRR